MANPQNTNRYFAEVFHVNAKALPAMSAYQLGVRGSEEPTRIGRKLADRLMRTFGGHWVWTDGMVVTEHPQLSEVLENALRSIRTKEKDAFKDLVTIIQSTAWIPSAQAQADFVAQGLLGAISAKMREALQPAIDLNGRAVVERDVDIRGWVAKGAPVISLSIDSRVIYRDDLKTYSTKMSNPADLVGIYVMDKLALENGRFYKGEILEVVGRLDIEVPRQHLLDIAQRASSKNLIEKADSGELVVRVGHGEYEYLISALRIVVFTKHYKRFGINTRDAQKNTWIAPSLRFELVEKVAAIARATGLIGDALTSSDRVFFESKAYKYDPSITLGNAQGQPGIVQYQGGGNLLNSLQRHGLYQRIIQAGILDEPLRIGVINASQQPLDSAKATLLEQLKILGYVRVHFEEVAVRGTSRVDFERVLNQLSPSSPHLVLAIIPDSDSLDEDDWGPYFDFKSLTMNMGIPSQVIDRDTLKNAKGLQYVMQNVAFGISAKLGNVPYILANGLDYADYVVGIDIARKRRNNGQGSLNAAAISQVFQKTGQFARCQVVETPLEGETVPAKILRSLFPLSEYEGRKVVIHRDGLFRGNEVQMLEAHLQSIGAEGFFVEIIKSGAPRLYGKHYQTIEAPDIGTALMLSETEAFLVASSSSTATPQPLHIRTRAPFTIGKALHSALMLTLMHYGSLRRPKLPITIHYSDKIGYLALRGVKPMGGVSNEMYWL